MTTSTPFDNFIGFLVVFIRSLTIWSLLKFLTLSFLFLYLAFSFIIIRQGGLMSKTISFNFNSVIKFISWLHFLFALGVFFLALIIL